MSHDRAAAAERLRAWAERCRSWEAFFRGLSQDPLILTKHPYDKDEASTEDAQGNAEMVAEQERQQAEDLELAILVLTEGMNRCGPQAEVASLGGGVLMEAPADWAREYLSDTRLKAFRRCKRLHYIRYELGYRRLERAEALRFGDLIHAGQEAWWGWDFQPARLSDRSRSGWPNVDPDPLEHALRSMRARAEKLQTEPYELVRAEEMMRGYHFRWREVPLRALAVEADFEMRLVHPLTRVTHPVWRLRGRLDIVARHLETGEDLIVEHKSSSESLEAGGAYWQKRRLDTQVSVYFEGARALGYAPAGCIFDVLAKPRLEPLKATPPEKMKRRKGDGQLYAGQREADETPEEYRLRLREAIAEEPERYFQRGEVPRLERELEEAMRDIWEESELLDHSRFNRLWPRSAPDACFAYGRPCDFWGVCSGGESLDDTTKFKRRAGAGEKTA